MTVDDRKRIESVFIMVSANGCSVFYFRSVDKLQNPCLHQLHSEKEAYPHRSFMECRILGVFVVMRCFIELSPEDDEFSRVGNFI